MSGRAAGIHRGLVARYDSPAGIGEIFSESGGRYFFHCSAIADGSREIAEGAAVAFTLSPGHLGRYEARDIGPRAP